MVSYAAPNKAPNNVILMSVGYRVTRAGGSDLVENIRGMILQYRSLDLEQQVRTVLRRAHYLRAGT